MLERRCTLFNGRDNGPLGSCMAVPHYGTLYYAATPHLNDMISDGEQVAAEEPAAICGAALQLLLPECEANYSVIKDLLLAVASKHY